MSFLDLEVATKARLCVHDTCMAGLCSGTILSRMEISLNTCRIDIFDNKSRASVLKESDTPENAELFFSALLTSMKDYSEEGSRNLFVFSDCLSEDSWEGAVYGQVKTEHVRFKNFASYLGIEPVTTYTSKRTGNEIAVWHYVISD